jgi:DNA-binding winged helix-turn-helix (wHTH) protein/tetratricopeptide (TPR) repeat protein/TolB-like protein
MRSAAKQYFDFGPYHLDPVKRLLFRAGEPVALTPKAFDTLLILVQNAGRVLGKEELMRSLWPDTFVEDGNLTQNIFMLRKALGESATDRYIITVPGHGYRFAADVKDLSIPDTDLVVESHSRSRIVIEEKRTWSGLLLAAAMTVVILSAVYSVYSTWKPPRRAPTSGLGVRRSVAVLGFKNLSGQLEIAWLSTAVAEMLSTELAAGEQLRLIPGEDIARMQRDLPVIDAASLSKETLNRIRRNVGADLIVVGAYTAIGETTGRRIRLDLRLQDTALGETVSAVAETGTESKVFELVSQVGARLRQQLGVGEVSTAEAAAVRAAMPATSEAVRLYAEGLAKLRMFDALAARDVLLKAVNVEPGYPLAHAALASAWAALGYDAESRKEAQQALELSAKLASGEHLSVGALYYESRHEWDKAIETYRSLYNSTPDNLDYGLRLARAQTYGGKIRDALATVGALRKLPPPTSEDVRIDLTEATAYHDLSDFRQELAAATRAEKGAKGQGARLLLARAVQERGMALQNLGKRKEAASAFEEAKNAFALAGNQKGVANALNDLAIIADWEGDYAGAKRMYEESGAISEQTGNRSGVANSFNNLSQLLTEQGDLKGSLASCQKSLTIYREIGDRQNVGSSLCNCAGALQGLADLPAAKKMFEDSLKIAQEAGNRDSIALQTYNIGTILTEQGDLSGAGKLLEQARAIWQANGDRASLAYALYSLGEVALAQSDFATARRMHEQAFSIRRELAEKVSTAESRLSLANLALEEGQAGPALKDAQATAELFRTYRVPDDEAAAHLIVGGIFVLQGKLANARRALDHAKALGEKSQNPRVRLNTAILEARLEAYAKRGLPIKHVQETASQAKRLGLRMIELEARLANAEIDFKSPNPSAGRSQLAVLEQDARAAGFGLIAAKAHSSLSQLR